MKKGKNRMVTPREYAAMHDVAYTTVMLWLRNNWLDGVERQVLPFKATGKDGKEREMIAYLIPAETPRPERKPGPAKGSKKIAKKVTKKKTR